MPFLLFEQKQNINYYCLDIELAFILKTLYQAVIVMQMFVDRIETTAFNFSNFKFHLQLIRIFTIDWATIAIISY